MRVVVREYNSTYALRPVLEYACSVWCPWLIQDINQ